MQIFKEVAAKENNPKWEQYIQRSNGSGRRGEYRSEFEIDGNRILHCNAFRRLKHKTQVFFATRNDHICTRMEHVNHVNSVSYSIAKQLGLDTELTSAIALGHDLGHAPFGHRGEQTLSDIAAAELKQAVWHEKNSLHFVDDIETLPDSTGHERNLNLTYAVRDGIISHCGEVNENGLIPREEAVALESINRPNEYRPYSWEACVVKIADKVAYLGRDIEDALTLGILSDTQLDGLRRIINADLADVNNTIIMHQLIKDLCEESSPQKGICFSAQKFQMLRDIVAFNYENIYLHERLNNYHEYAELVIRTIYKFLKEYYEGMDTMRFVRDDQFKYPTIAPIFYGWLEKYSNALAYSAERKYQNKVLYKLENESQYLRSIIDFISGMTDQFAIRVFEEIISF